MEYNELRHWGIKGMKWGVRRYQNADGTYTSAGKKRRREEPHEDYTKAHSKKSVQSMSDAELRARNNRLQMEKQYADLTTKKSSAGKKFVTGVLVAAATSVATAYATKYMKKGAEFVESPAGRQVIKSKIAAVGMAAHIAAGARKISK